MFCMAATWCANASSFNARLLTITEFVHLPCRVPIQSVEMEQNGNWYPMRRSIPGTTSPLLVKILEAAGC